MNVTTPPSTWTAQQTASFLNGFQIVMDGFRVPVPQEDESGLFAPAPATAFNAPVAMEALLALHRASGADFGKNRLGVSLEIWNDRTNGYLVATRRNHDAPLIVGAWIAFGLSWQHFSDHGSLLGVKASAYFVVCPDEKRVLPPAILKDWHPQRAISAGTLLRNARERIASEFRSSAWEIENWGEPGMRMICPKSRPFAPLDGTAATLWRAGIRNLTVARVRPKD